MANQLRQNRPTRFVFRGSTSSSGVSGARPSVVEAIYLAGGAILFVNQEVNCSGKARRKGLMGSPVARLGYDDMNRAGKSGDHLISKTVLLLVALGFERLRNCEAYRAAQYGSELPKDGVS